MRIGWSAGERLGGIDVDCGAETAVENELCQRVEVDHVSPAGEDEHGFGPHELEQLAREQRPVLARRRREHEDDPRRREQLLQADRANAFVSEVGVGQPRVVRAELAAERLEQRTQAPADVPVADEAHLLAGEEEGGERLGAAQPALVRRTHRAVLGDDVAARRERECERHLRHGPGERRSGREHADAALEAVGVVELGRPAPGHGEDRPEPGCVGQHIAVPPSRRDDGERVREGGFELRERHRVVAPPDDVDELPQAGRVLGGEDVVHGAEVRVDDDLRAIRHGTQSRLRGHAHVITTAVSVASSSAPEWIAVPVSRSIHRIRAGSSRSHTSLSANGKRLALTETFSVSSPQRTVSRLCEPSGSSTITFARTRPSPAAVSTPMASARMPSSRSCPASADTSLGNSNDPPLTSTVAVLPVLDTRASRKFIGGVPMKPPTKVSAGLSYTSSGLPSWTMLPLIHHGDPVAHAQGLDLVVRDVDRRRVEALQQRLELRAHLEPKQGVEVRERLVHQQDVGLRGDRAGHRDTLALPAGELRRVAIEERLDVQELGRGADALVDDGLLLLLHAQPEGDVVVDLHVREDRVALEHHRDPPPPRCEVGGLAVADEHASLVHVLEPRQAAQQRRLAAPGRPEQDDELLVLHLEVDPVHGRELAEVLAHSLETDVSHVSSAPFEWVSCDEPSDGVTVPPAPTSSRGTCG